MKNPTALGAIAATAIVGMLLATPARGQATRTWVSGVGDDINPCSRTAPCKTFAGAISKTFINGEINCLDSGAFGAVTITKSITIDCHENFAGILAGGINGVVISVGVNANDPLRTVRLRNLNIDGSGASGSVGTRTGITGIRIDAALVVFLDDMMVWNFTQRGVLYQNTAAFGKLFIRNSTFRDNGQAGIAAVGAATSSIVLDNVHSIGNQFGIATGTGNNVAIKRSVMSGNSTAGVHADSGAQVNVHDSTISHNLVNGVQASGTIRLSNNDIEFNTTGISGATTSFGNNRISGNGAPGTAPTPAGGDTHDKGQQ